MKFHLHYFLPRTYAHKAQEWWYRLFYDLAAVRREEQEKFISAGFDRSLALKELNKHLAVIGQPDFDEGGGMASVHWLLFACLRQHHSFKRILEIGTFDGQTTALLASIFPESEIITLDLPSSDPLLRKTYARKNRTSFEEFERRQAQNTSAPQITLLKLNSFFLPSAVQGPFDLVWVDGGHLYPEIAWDLCNAYHLIRNGGVMMCDDVIMHSHGLRDDYVSPDSYKVLRYVTDRTNDKLWLFLKREAAQWSANPRHRKFVALLCKTGNKDHAVTSCKTP